MKFCCFPILVAAALLAHAPFAYGDDKWIQIKSGPFEVLSNSGDKPARDGINTLEQLRYSLGATISRPEMKTVFPIRILLAKGRKAYPQPKLARDAYVAATPAIGPETLEAVTRILLNENAGRL